MYLIFRFDQGDTRFIIDGRKVMSVMAAERIFAMPRQRKEVVGLVRKDDLLIPVYDFRPMLGEACSSSSTSTRPPHLILFYGNESLNAFLAEAIESVTADCLMADCTVVSPFLAPQQVLYNDAAYMQLNFTAIEALLNIP